MTAQDFDQPYMVYEGELPRHLRPRPGKPTLRPPRQEAEEAAEANEADGAPGLSWFGLFVFAGVLALGVAIGVSGTLMLHRPKVAPPAPARIAFEATLIPNDPPRAQAPAVPPEIVPPQLAAMLQPAEAVPASASATAPQAAALRIARADGPAPRVATSRAAHSCSSASGRAEYAICANPELAAADLEMRRAYQRAVASGAPQRPLRASQEDWLILSEVAADRSTAELAGAYRARIAELNALVQDPPH